MKPKRPPTERLYARLLDTHIQTWIAGGEKRTRAMLAKILRVAPSQISRWSNGVRPDPGIWVELFTALKLDPAQRAELEQALKAPR